MKTAGTGHKGPAKGSKRPPKGQPHTMKAPKLAINATMIYTVSQLAQILQVGEKTARAILREKELPARKVGQEWRILGRHILVYMMDFRLLKEGQKS